MKYTSLEDCINDLKKTGQLKIITKQVDPDLEIASIHLEEYKKSGKKYKAIAGDCYIQAVEWSPDKKVNAWSIHQYGSATKDKLSPHYDDQANLFHQEKMKQIR